MCTWIEQREQRASFPTLGNPAVHGPRRTTPIDDFMGTWMWSTTASLILCSES